MTPIENTVANTPTLPPGKYPEVNGIEIRPYTYWKGKKKGQNHFTGYLLIDVDKKGSFSDNVPHVVLVELGKDPNTENLKITLALFLALIDQKLFIQFTPAVQ